MIATPERKYSRINGQERKIARWAKELSLRPMPQPKFHVTEDEMRPVVRRKVAQGGLPKICLAIPGEGSIISLIMRCRPNPYYTIYLQFHNPTQHAPSE